MRHVKLQPGQTQFSLKCACGDLSASGVLDASAVEALLEILLQGHEGHRHNLERRDGASEAKEAA